MDKKGDIPIGILVLGTFLVCAMALLSFYISDIKTGKTFVAVDLMEKMEVKISEYSFYRENGFSYDKIKTIFLAEEDFAFDEDFFLIEKKTSVFKFAWSTNSDDWSKEKLLFSCKYYPD